MRLLPRVHVALTILFAFILVLFAHAAGQPEPTIPAKVSEPAEPNNRPLPFRGNLKSVDKAAGTLTIGNRTFEVIASTKFFRGSQPAHLEDGVKGEWVTGSYRRAEGNKSVANTVYFGGKTETQPGGKSAAKAKKL